MIFEAIYDHPDKEKKTVHEKYEAGLEVHLEAIAEELTQIMVEISEDLYQERIAVVFIMPPGYDRTREGHQILMQIISDLTDRGIPVAISGY